jgi:MoaA/NifB/PqqE/SkfB family radical SAM enzyme
LLNKINGTTDVKINTVATKVNKNDLINILNIIKEYRINRWKIFRFYPLRRGAEYKEKFYLCDDESDELENVINQMKKSVNFEINYNNFNEFTSSYFNIYPDGSIENSKDEIIGNLLEKSIFEIMSLKDHDLSCHYLRNHIRKS